MRRSASEVIGILRNSGLRIFRTGDAALLTGLSGAATVKALDRLAAEKLVVRLRRGLWASLIGNDLHPYEMVPHLTAPWPSYVSLYSVLSEAGVVEEIPQVVYAVTSGRPSVFNTPLGQVRVHHLPAELIWGYGMRSADGGSFPIADKEKAFLDLIYLALSPRSRLEMPHRRGRSWKLDRGIILAYAKRFRRPSMLACLEKLRVI